MLFCSVENASRNQMIFVAPCQSPTESSIWRKTAVGVLQRSPGSSTPQCEKAGENVHLSCGCNSIEHPSPVSVLVAPAHKPSHCNL